MLVSLWSVFVTILLITDVALGGTITEGPKNVTIGDGDTVTLKCKVTKIPGDEVQWFRGRKLFFTERLIESGVVSILDEFRFSVKGTTDNEYNLKITGASSVDVNQYTCKVHSKISSEFVAASAYLTVHSAPNPFTPECTTILDGRIAEDAKYTVDDNVEFRCISKPGTPNVKLEWSNNNMLINSSLQASTSLTQHFTRLLGVEDDGKTFTCTSMYMSPVVRNQTDSCEIRSIVVQYPPTDINIDSDGNVDYGKPLLLTCNANGGNPDVMNYNWTIFPVNNTERTGISERGDVLQLQYVEVSDQGLVIECSATNGIGEVLKTNITINVTNIPTTREPTTTATRAPSTTAELISPLMSFSTTYIVIVILIALVILLATVCLVLFLVNRKNQKEPLLHMPISQVSSDVSRGQNYGRQCSTNTWLEDDACSLKGKGSRPGTPCMDRRITDVEIKLQSLQSDKLKTIDNVYGDALNIQPGDSVSNRASPLPEHRQMHGYLSSEPDDLKKPRRSPRDSPDSTCSSHHSRQCHTTTPNPERGHRKLRPTNSTGPDWPKQYSPLARRNYTPQEQLQYPEGRSSPSPGIPNTYHTIGASPRTRRATQGDLDEYEQQNLGPSRKTHRRNHSQGSASNIILDSPITPVMSPGLKHYQQHSESPVMQRKHRRQTSGSSLHQLQVLQQHEQQGPSSRHNSPRPSPRPSPHSSPVHRQTVNRPLPDPGLDNNEDLLVEFDSYGTDLGSHNYSNRTPVSARKQYYTAPQAPQTEYYDDNEYDDEFIDEDDICSIHGDAACDCDGGY